MVEKAQRALILLTPGETGGRRVSNTKNPERV
jgi:hypothetical protein